MSSTHPKPWSTKQQELPSSMVARGMEVWHVVDANGGRVFTYDNEWKDAALEIVAAVNSHSDLLAACEAASNLLGDLASQLNHHEAPKETHLIPLGVRNQLKAAISKARGHQ